jgi:hypothetical protein
LAKHIEKRRRTKQVEVDLKSEFVGGAYASYPN